MCLNEDASAHSSSLLIHIQVCSLSGLLKRDPARIGLQAEKHPGQVRLTHAGRKKKGKKQNKKHSHLWALYTFRFTWPAWLVEGKPCRNTVRTCEQSSSFQRLKFKPQFCESTPPTRETPSLCAFQVLQILGLLQVVVGYVQYRCGCFSDCTLQGPEEYAPIRQIHAWLLGANGVCPEARVGKLFLRHFLLGLLTFFWTSRLQGQCAFVRFGGGGISLAGYSQNR